MSLSGFRPPYLPDLMCIKMVYSDYRAITASGSQGEYVYRLNSCFDPDATGVGGQPDGFDFWKSSYQIYRVVASDVEVTFNAQNGSNSGLGSFAPSTSSANVLNAEEIGGLSHARVGSFTGAKPLVLRSRYHTGQLFGMSDESVLADTEYGALISANPTKQQYLHVCVETANGATDVTMIRVKITYYTRFEKLTQTVDTVAIHAARAAAGLAPRVRVSEGSQSSGMATALDVANKTAADAAAVGGVGTTDSLRRLADSVKELQALLNNP